MKRCSTILPPKWGDLISSNFMYAGSLQMPCSFPFSSDGTCNPEHIVKSTSYECPMGLEQNPGGARDKWCKMHPAKHILSLDVDERKTDVARQITTSNYWLAETRKAGKDQGFTMDLGCKKTVAGVALRNTHNGPYRDYSTKKLRILGSATDNGPWKELLVANLEDSRQQKPPPVENLMFAKSSVVSFIKVELLEYYGPIGGGLQYFAIEGPESTTTTSKQQI